MNFLIVGCGRVGVALAMRYAKAGHQVRVIDEDEEASAHLGPDFKGSFTKGAGLDVELLRECGVEDTDVLIAVTDGDNTNLVVAQIAREQFQVPCVVVRVFDPRRAEFYGTKGMNVVCPVALTVDLMHGAVCNYSEEVAP